MDANLKLEESDTRACCPDAGEPGCHGQTEPCPCVSCSAKRKPYMAPSVISEPPRQIAYRHVARLIDEDLPSIPAEFGALRVQLERIRDAMTVAGNGGQ